MTCPYGQIAPVELGSQKKGYVAQLSVSICETCPFHQAGKCPTRFRKRKQFYGLYFMPSRMRLASRRKRNQVFQSSKQNPRAAVEATVRAVKLPFPIGKLPVRGRLRMFYMMIGSAAINNVRQIQRYLALKLKNLPQDYFCFFSPKMDSGPEVCLFGIATCVKALFFQRSLFFAIQFSGPLGVPSRM
jgi:hypothetical protein